MMAKRMEENADHVFFVRRTEVLGTSDVLALLRRYLPSGDAPPCLRDLSVYQRAMVHRSYATRVHAKRDIINRRCPEGVLGIQADSYERLEFLGDAVLGLATASYLYERYPDQDEGFMTRMRTQLVNGKMLADLCLRHTPLPGFVAVSSAYEGTGGGGGGGGCGKDLGGKGEGKNIKKKTKQKKQDHPNHASSSAMREGESIPYNVLEDVFEAFLGAIFVDQGFDVARRWMVGFLEANVDFSELASKQDGPKAILNRHCMRHLGFLPRVEELDVGVVRIMAPDGTVISTGMASASAHGSDTSLSASCSRRAAEDAAVRKALTYYGLSASRGGSSGGVAL